MILQFVGAEMLARLLDLEKQYGHDQNDTNVPHCENPNANTRNSQPLPAYAQIKKRNNTHV